MSDTLKSFLESIVMISVLTAGFVWYALAAGRKEPEELPGQTAEKSDPDAHLGHRGTE
jgi:hypothetical protein